MTPFVVVADQAEWRDGGFVASGVRAEGRDWVATADRATGDEADLVLWNAIATDARGVLRADRLSVPWQGGPLVATGALWTGVDGFIVAADTWIVGDESWLGHGIVVQPCACEGRDPYALRADSLTVSPGERMSWQGGRLDLFEAVSVPLPDGQRALGRHPTLRWPEVGFGSDGFVAALPAWFPLGPRAGATLRPELRTGRGALVGLDATWADDRVDGALAWEPGALRGQMGGRASAASIDGHAAVDGTLPTDPDFFADWGGDWLGRSLPWHELRAAAGAGPWTAHADTFVDHRVADQRLAALRWAPVPQVLPGGILLRTHAEGAATAAGATPWAVATPEPEALGALLLERPSRVGPIVLEPTVGANALSTRQLTTTDAVLGLGVGLDAWRLRNARWERLEPRWRASTRWIDGVRTDRTGPALRWSTTTEHTRTAAEGYVEGGVGPPSGGGLLTLEGRHLSASLVADSADQGQVLATAGVGGGPIRPSATMDWAPALELFQAGGIVSLDVPGTRRTTTARLLAAAEVDDPAWATRGLELGWRHPTGCLSVSAVGRLDADRPGPSVGLRVEIPR